MSGRRIVHVVQSLATGGLENGVVNLVNASAERWQHAIVCLSDEGALRARLRSGLEVRCIKRSPGRSLRFVMRLAAVFRQLRPDVVHSRNWPTFDAIVAARLARVPVVIHGEHGREAADPLGRNARRNRLRRAVSPLVTRWVTVSRDLGRWLIEQVRIPSHKVTTIHNGVDLSRFVPASSAGDRSVLGLDAGALVIGTVGRLDPVKDQAALVRAFAEIRRVEPSAHLVIAGAGPCRADLEALVRDLRLAGSVRLLGERHDIPRVLAAFDVFVLPSIAEGISNTVLEAMASGLPVVATRVGGNPELVEDGVTGLIVPPSDVPALRDAVSVLVGDAAFRMNAGQAGRRRALEHFSLERMCRRYSELYTELGAVPAMGGA